MKPQGLEQAWLHSREEDQGGEQVFRPQGFSFPRSRGREGFRLDPDGVLTLLGIAPADGTLATPGSWSLSHDQLLTLRPEGQKEQQYQLVSVAKDKLVVRRVVP